MNYNISGIDMMILEIFAMFDTAKVEIKKEHQLLRWLVKPLVSRRARARWDTSGKGKPVAALMKKPKIEPKPETKCFCYEGNSH